MPDMQLPRYNKNSISIKNDDFESIVNIRDIDTLSKKIYGCTPAQLSENNIKSFLAGEAFKKGADYSENETYNNKIVRLITEIHTVAKNAGFPGKPRHNGAQFDILLAKTFYTLCEELGIQCRPSEINDDELQAFATQRIFPLITFWRWSHNEIINESRIRPGMRNYFYTLLITAWLFDNQGMDESDRWKYLSILSADIIVAIIERPGIGYRRGFALAVAEEILRRKSQQDKQNIDRLVRGVMKRATFTFSVSVMPDERDYYREITKYLFEWSENNYIAESDTVAENTVEDSGDNGSRTREYALNYIEENVFGTVYKNKKYSLEPEVKQTSDSQSENDNTTKPEYWFAMSKWAKENDYFDGRSRKFIFQVGTILNSRKELTPKQLKYKNSIYCQAKELGFNDKIEKDETPDKKKDELLKTIINLYLKKLTANELGYRNGNLSNGQMFYISKQAKDFFPPLSTEINNDSVILEVNVEYRSEPVCLNLVYHNDKFNREDGTRDEYRIYLNREIAPDEFFFRPDDIIVFERLDKHNYNLKKFREGNSEYNKLNEIIKNSSTRGQHALINKI
jgi:hypothetical protein